MNVPLCGISGLSYTIQKNPLAKTTRRAWCKCADELGEMVSEEVKTNSRYNQIRKI